MSRTALEGALIRGKVMICEIVYAELAAAFDGDGNLLDSFLDDIGVAFEASSKEILLKAGRLWRQSSGSSQKKSLVTCSSPTQI